MTITTNRLDDPTVGFPETLMLVPVKEDRLPASFYQGHNRAVQDFIKANVGATNGLRRTERGILALAAGIDQLVGSWAECHDPVFGLAVHNLLDGFGDLLNYDCGRLDRGTLSEWTGVIRRVVGIDDNGEWVGKP